MNGSLERRLSRTLAVAILAGGGIAAGTSFYVGYLEARDLQDDTLRQVAHLSASRRHPEADSEILSLYLPGEPRPPWLPANLAPGFHTLPSGRGSVRVYVLRPDGGERIVAAQATELREDVATSSALHTLVPVLLLLPLLAWLTNRVFTAERSALERERRFIADAAHELRSPLTALSLQAENVEKAPSLEAARERIGALREGIERSRRLTQQLLRLAHPGGRPGPAPRIDASSLVRELISDALPAARAKAIDLGLEERARPAVLAAHGDLALVLNNGLDNALRFAPPASEVTIVVDEDGTDAIFEIHDAGPGIPPAQRSAVFEAFHRLAGAGEGSGLGLTIAREAAERLGGTIVLAARPHGTGLVFRYRQRKA